MSRYSAMLAEKVRFAGASREDVRLASALHDVGKIGVPDSILLKPGALDPDEYAVMQRHAQLGFRLLNGSASDLLQLGSVVALNHHEWWDGNGYPQGLRGDEIPELARIAAVSDVFDALTSDRVYRPAMPFDDAIEIMVSLRGRQFEPRLSDAFLSSMDEVRLIRDANPDVEAHGGAPIRVLVVDDRTMLAESLVRLLGDEEGIVVLGRAASLAEARALVAAQEPDVILMDFELPDGDGAAGTREIKMVTPSAKVIMLTADTDEDALVRAIAAGCSGFVDKREDPETLVSAVRSAHQGEAVISPERLPALLERLRPTRRGLTATLTPREIEILGLVASGLSDDAIAQRIFVSPVTVRNHVQNVLFKLQVHSKLEAVATAAREGVIDHRSRTS
jgi:response regulator RpfG family c-di-GMP phosphodiesterase/DNA-binding CsgD family transcriptional regulator